MAKRWYLTARKALDGPPIWYVRFRDEHGAIGSALSTHETDKGKAEQWAIERLLKGETSSLRQPKSQTFEEWAAPWWRFETCPYIREKIANGFTISPAYAFIRRSYLDRHLIPEFGSVPLTALTPRHFRDLKMKLYQEGKLAPATINRIIGTARIMFNYAVSMKEPKSTRLRP